MEHRIRGRLGLFLSLNTSESATILTNDMTIPRKYLHDRLILLLLSTNLFMAALCSLWVFFKLSSSHNAAYIVQYRASLGISALKTGSAGDLLAFVGFAILVAVLHAVLSVKAYPIRREVSVVILAFGVLLLILSLIVSNALLTLR